jgi:lipopolysaccharide biosynthesis glycosyltransferase
MRSILRNGGGSCYHAYILHSDLQNEDMEHITEHLGNSVICHFIVVDPTMFAGFPESKRYPKQIYYRLAAPLLLPENLSRILYLDVDTVVIGSLQELYETDFSGFYYVACTHTRAFLSRLNQARLGIHKKVPYVNTGVMLLNLSALRENLKLQDIQDFAQQRMRTFLLPDQDILTALYGDKILLTDTLRYNLSDRILGFYNADPKHPKIDLNWVRQNTSIIHYCGKNKPWRDGYVGSLGVFYQEQKEGMPIESGIAVKYQEAGA